MYILSKQKSIWLWVALLTSISMVASIPAIILFAINERFLLMGISIALLAHGFYGSVFYWVAFSKRCSYIRIVKLIINEGMLTVSILCMQTGKREQEVISILRESIVKGYITGYYYDEVSLSLCKIAPITKAVECESCGASVTTINGFGECEYCGTKINT